MLRLVAYVLVLLTMLVTSLSTPQYVVGEDIYAEVTYLMRDLEYLHSMGVDVGLIVDLLNRAMEAYRGGSVAEAYRCLNEVKRVIEELKLVAESIYVRALVVKVITIGSLASLPIVVYLMLPRVYLYLWFKLHRKWVVRR